MPSRNSALGPDGYSINPSTRRVRNRLANLAPDKLEEHKVYSREYGALFQACIRQSRRADYKVADVDERRCILVAALEKIMENRRRAGISQAGIKIESVIDNHLRKEKERTSARSVSNGGTTGQSQLNNESTRNENVDAATDDLDYLEEILTNIGALQADVLLLSDQLTSAQELIHMLVEQQGEDTWRYGTLMSRMRRPRSLASYSPHPPSPALPLHRRQLINENPAMSTRRAGYQHRFSDRMAPGSLLGLRAVTPHYHRDVESEDETDMDGRGAEKCGSHYRGRGSSRQAYIPTRVTHEVHPEDNAQTNIRYALDPCISQASRQDGIYQSFRHHQTFRDLPSGLTHTTARQQQHIPTDVDMPQPMTVMMVSEQGQAYPSTLGANIRQNQTPSSISSGLATSMPSSAWTSLHGSSLFTGGPAPNMSQQRHQVYSALGPVQHQPQPQVQSQQNFHQSVGVQAARPGEQPHEQELQGNKGSSSTQA